MDIATSTISNIVTAGVPHAAQEARRDSMARETIPQINQNAQSANNAAVSQGSVQTAPVNSSLFIQTDVLIKANGEKVSSKKELAKTEKKEDTKETKGTGGGKAASSSSASGASLNQNVTASGAMNAALGGSFVHQLVHLIHRMQRIRERKVKVTALKLLLINTTAVDLNLT